MKKLIRLCLTTLLLTVLFVTAAHAEALTVQADLPYGSPYTYMLRSGDTLHCLTIGFRGEYSKDVTEITRRMAAQCHVLRDGALAPGKPEPWNPLCALEGT